MTMVDDSGKIWIRGTTRPEHGVRVGKLYFATGKEDSEIIECRVDEKYLWVDLHNKKKQCRTARRFALDLPAKTLGALFSGFDKTQHADVRVSTYHGDGVEEFVVGEETYLSRNIEGMESELFWQMAGWD